MNDVRRPKQHDAMLTDLSQGSDSIFRSYKDLLVFAACLGFEKDEKVPFDRSSEPIGIHIFHAEFDEAIFHCIGLSETDDPMVMGHEKEVDRIRIFEEYANGGLEILARQVYNGPEDWEEALVRLISEQLAETSSILDDITNLAE